MKPNWIFALYAAGVALSVMGASYTAGYAYSQAQQNAKCVESAETARMTACVKASGSWVAGNCVGPLPEGK